MFHIGTHSVIAINVSIASRTEITCIFHADSHAIGCLIHMTNIANGITHCIALQRFSNVSLSDLPICQSRNVTLDTGRYLLQVYDIETRGEISAVPAVVDEILLGTSTALEPSVSRKSKFSADTSHFFSSFHSIDALNYI